MSAGKTFRAACQRLTKAEGEVEACSGRVDAARAALEAAEASGDPVEARKARKALEAAQQALDEAREDCRILSKARQSALVAAAGENAEQAAAEQERLIAEGKRHVAAIHKHLDAIRHEAERVRALESDFGVRRKTRERAVRLGVDGARVGPGGIWKSLGLPHGGGPLFDLADRGV